ncbi:MAG: TIGR01777 family oxidoreductase [Acidobacteria bacterium]|nr:TIGR01777 family oxidoreductase [Acidobacteriota bacterium]
MKIVIAGGTGFLGRPLCEGLVRDGHEVVVLTRSEHASVPAGVRAVAWDPKRAAAPWAGEIDGSAAVINLAGEPIADHRWTAAQKHRIEDSRVAATERIVQAIASAEAPPALLLNGSAVGFYGHCGDAVVTEETGAGHDFLAAVCRRWEAQAVAASSSTTRVVCLRTGLVLSKRGGALPKLLPAFKLGVGGRLGSGKQYWPWIHHQDWVNLVRFIVATPGVVGPINATAPAPVTNAEFSGELGRALGRPTFFPVPRLALVVLLGEMADAMLLSGQRAVPARAQQLGFTFAYPTLALALDAILHHE